VCRRHPIADLACRARRHALPPDTADRGLSCQAKSAARHSPGSRHDVGGPAQIIGLAQRCTTIRTATAPGVAMAFTIRITGTEHIVDVDGDTALLWVLRDVLGMTGTKFGCGAALCGACTVHIDGAPTRSCITTIDSVGDAAVTTIEAIGGTPQGKVLQ